MNVADFHITQIDPNAGWAHGVTMKGELAGQGVFIHAGLVSKLADLEPNDVVRCAVTENLKSDSQIEWWARAVEIVRG